MSKLSFPPPARGRSASVEDASREGGVSSACDPTPDRRRRSDPPLSGAAEERNASRLSEARLHAVSSRNMYSEHGLDARIGPDAGQVCQSLTVLWNCRPGSALAQAA